MAVKKEREPIEFSVRVFLGDKEIPRDELQNVVIKSNTVSRIVNSIVDQYNKYNKERE